LDCKIRGYSGAGSYLDYRHLGRAVRVLLSVEICWGHRFIGIVDHRKCAMAEHAEPMTGLLSHVLPGYIVRPSEPGAMTEWEHCLFGPHLIAGAASPNSQRPLLRLLQFDMADPRLGFHGNAGEVLPLLFSWSCEISQSPFIYRVPSNTTIELITYRQGEAYDDFPYPGYPSHFPERTAVLIPIPPREQDAIRSLNSGTMDAADLAADQRDLYVPRHQVGGEPFLVQPWQSLDCPSCERPMPFLASVGDETGTPKGLTGNRFVQTCFSYCAECRVIGARQQCD